jgi:hypothetical protein
MSYELRIIDWNLQKRRDVGKQLDFVDSLGWDILLLQEVYPERVIHLRNHPGVGDLDTALRHRPDRVTGHLASGSAIVVREGLGLLTSSPLVNVPSPERTLTGIVQVDGRHLTVAALAAPPGVSWDELEAVQVNRYGDLWASRTLPLIVRIDRNTPRVDHPDLDGCDWFWEAKRKLYGPDPKHDLRDALRVYLGDNEDKMACIRSNRPEGPLATSFLRGHKTPARYDAIYASSEFEVLKVEYHCEDALKAGSDHGLVWARLQWNDSFVAPAGHDFPDKGGKQRVS